MAHGAVNNLQLNRYLYGGKEYQDAQVGGSMLGLYDFHARYYNPVLGRWFNQDPALQTSNPYLYCGNSPMMYVDPDGEIFWLIVGAFAAGNVLAHAINGDINDFWDFAEFAFQGALAGAAVGGAYIGLAAMGASSMGFVSTIGKVGTTLMEGYAIAQTGASAVGLIGASIQSIDQGSLKPMGNWAKLTLGNFYLDENGDTESMPKWMQGFLRHTWEAPQQLLGHGFSQFRNSLGKVDRVEYFGGATFAIDENVQEYNGWRGVSLGSYINAKIPGSFNQERHEKGWVYGEKGLYLHEYGHTKDSRRYGFSYLPVIGIASASGSEWTETRANRHAWKYMKRHRLLDSWEEHYPNFPLR